MPVDISSQWKEESGMLSLRPPTIHHMFPFRCMPANLRQRNPEHDVLWGLVDATLRPKPDIANFLLGRMSHRTSDSQASRFAPRSRGQVTITPSGFHSVGAPSGRVPPPPPPPPPQRYPYPLPLPQAARPFVQPQLPYNYANYHNQAAPPCFNNLHPPCPPSLARKRHRELDVSADATTKAFACDPCSLTFDSKSALDAHVSSHVTCTACSFQAAPRAVKAHHQAAHGKFSGSGFKTITVAIPGCPVQRYRICVGNRPEDIAAWISERKRRFPRSSANSASATEPGQTLRNEKTGNPLATTASPSPAQGLSSLLDGYGSSSDEETEENDKESPPLPPALVPAQPYESAVPSETTLDQRNDPNALPITSGRQTKSPCRFFASHGNCRNGESCRFLHEMANAGSLPVRSDRTESPSRGRIGKPSAPPSLLEKLLANDVRRERLLTIQLLEHIAFDANFFSNPEGRQDPK